MAQADARSTSVLGNELETSALECLYQGAIVHGLQPSILFFDLECSDC
jgi:hypothetical protein